MFFSGNPSRGKVVDLGGRSSKERERQKYLEQTRLERERRQRLRQQTLSALVIQKFFRGTREALAARAVIRQGFCLRYGENGGRFEINAFKPNSKYLHQLLFFFSANDNGDVLRLVEACKLLHQSVQVSGNILDVFTDGDYHNSSNRAIIQYRVKRFAICCLQVVHQNMEQLKSELLRSSGEFADSPGLLLLDTVISLTDFTLPWAGNTIDCILQTYTFSQFRDLILSLQGIQTSIAGNGMFGLECLLTRLASNSVHKFYTDHNMHLSFAAQILSIPFLWKQFPNLKQDVMSQGLWPYYIQQIATVLPSLNFLPEDKTSQLPSNACLLGNVLEIAGFALSRPNCTLQTAMSFSNIASFLLEEIPHNFMPTTSKQSDNDMEEDEGQIILSKDLENQILSAVDLHFLKHLVRFLYRDKECFGESTNSSEEPSSKEAESVTAICKFLHVSITMLPLENVMTGLAYTTELVPTLWHYMKRCHLSQKWSSMEAFAKFPLQPGDPLSSGWLLSLSVFCPFYRHMLTITDNEEFYEQQKPLSLQDVKELVNILKEALWQLLWVIPSKVPKHNEKSVQSVTNKKGFQLHGDRLSILAAELLAQLQDWNCRKQFTSPDDFHARDAVEGRFSYTKAGNENPIARDLLKRAPFLVPFTKRVQIYTSLLASAKEQNRSSHIESSERYQIRIRRDRAVEDAFRELNGLTGDQLRGIIRVTFVNEFGVEEAGIDGGGIFKDFMENITKTAFDIQYGLFKETDDHLLYPNPASAKIYSEHLQYFEFLGKILGKAMFEGILVDIPFATFFLSKLKEKHNYLQDLPSLDPELYRNLLYLKKYDGDVSQLGLYFVSEINEYGEQKEQEMLPGGKDAQVTNENVIRFIHLLANSRLNDQINNQSSSFLRGFRHLIESDWVDMFNEHELQLLISGSTGEGKGLDVDDLRSNVHYSGYYTEDHSVIQMLWEVIKEFNLEQQKKFLKFVTGCSRGPLLGFRYLEPPISIRSTTAEDGPEDALDRLPTSATCMHLLKLPPYRTKEVLRTKLLYAISAGAGFDLS